MSNILIIKKLRKYVMEVSIFEFIIKIYTYAKCIKCARFGNKNYFSCISIDLVDGVSPAGNGLPSPWLTTGYFVLHVIIRCDVVSPTNVSFSFFSSTLSLISPRSEQFPSS